MRMVLLLFIMVTAATSTQVFISDVVDVKINDVDTEQNVLNNDNTADNENPSVVEVSLVEDDVNFLISRPNIENVDSTSQDYPEELYLPDEDPIDNTINDTLGSDDIIDVIKNFIAERDPILQLFLNICFLHPNCYQLDNPSTTNYSSSSQDMVDNLLARRTETARNILVNLIKEVQEKIKVLMFKYIEKSVGERGVSLIATKSIIDYVKSIWISLNGDLEYAKSSIQELFYLLPLDTKEQVQAMVEITEVVQKIPYKTEILLQKATQEGYQQYARNTSWDN